MASGNASRISELDGVRGVAIVMVLVWHYLGVPLTPAGVVLAPHHWIPSFKLSLILGRSGVDLFFVLSGFLITGILLDHRESTTYYRTFYTRRLFRIVPLYMVFVGLFAGGKALGMTGHFVDGPVPLWGYLTFTQNYFMAAAQDYGALFLSATWSLAVEEQFYLLFPFLLRQRHSFHLPLLVAGIVMAPLLRIWCFHHYHGDDAAAYMWLPCRLDSLCWGGLAAKLLRMPAARAWLIERRRSVATLLLPAGIAVAFLDAALGRNIAFHMTLWGHTLLAIAYALLVLVVVLYAQAPGTGFFRWRPLIYVGRVSYGVYLIHGVILGAVFEVAHRQPQLTEALDSVRILTALALMFGLAAASFRWFEGRFLAYGHKAKYL